MGTLAGPVTRWNDYVGAAAADDAPVLMGSESLYDLSGLDRDRWTIVAVDLLLAHHGNAATVYAVEREAPAAAAGEPTADAEPLLVHPFAISAQAVDDFLQRAFDRVAVRLVTQQYRSSPLVLAEAADLQPRSAPLVVGPLVAGPPAGPAELLRAET